MKTISVRRQHLRWLFALITSLHISGCTMDQISRGVYNVATGKLCLERDRDQEGAFGVEPCTSNYDLYKRERNKELDKLPPRTRPSDESIDEGLDDEKTSTVLARASDSIDGCWISFDPNPEVVSNELTLCINEHAAQMKIYYPNLNVGDPTECSHRGTIHDLKNDQLLLALNAGTCKNGREIGAINFECEKSATAIDCTHEKIGYPMRFSRRVH